MVSSKRNNLVDPGPNGNEVYHAHCRGEDIRPNVQVWKLVEELHFTNGGDVVISRSKFRSAIEETIWYSHASSDNVPINLHYLITTTNQVQ
jgi:hypothetical protein